MESLILTLILVAAVHEALAQPVLRQDPLVRCGTPRPPQPERPKSLDSGQLAQLWNITLGVLRTREIDRSPQGTSCRRLARA